MIDVLVTGANGQLATCLKDLAREYKNLNFIYTDYRELDICDANQVDLFFEANPSIEYCINCAAYTAVDKAEEEYEKAYLINVKGPQNLALSCLKFTTKLVHISTDFVFDGKKREPYTELDSTNPISVYGETKLKGEQEIISNLKEHFIIRTSWLYSEHGSNFMKTMLKLAETREELSVVGDQFGTPTYAGDLAKVILDLVNSQTTKYGLYHFSNSGTASWYEFALAILKEADVSVKLNSIKTKDYPTAANRPVYSVLDKNKIIKQLGVSLSTWQESLKIALKKSYE